MNTYSIIIEVKGEWSECERFRTDNPDVLHEHLANLLDHETTEARAYHRGIMVDAADWLAGATEADFA